MLLLAHLLTLNPLWSDAIINLRSIVTSETAQPDIEQSIADLIEIVRIRAKQDVILLPEGRSVVEIMQETSKDADVVFLGLMTPEEDKEAEYTERLIQMIEPLPTTILVRNSGPFQGQLI